MVTSSVFLPDGVRTAMSTWEQQAISEGIDMFAVGALVRKGGAVLIMQRNSDDFLPDMFEIPGGSVEEGETLLDALERELREETSLSHAQVLRVIEGFDYMSEHLRLVRQLNFEVETIESDVVHHPEHQAVAWVDAETIDTFPMSTEMKTVVQRALSANDEH